MKRLSKDKIQYIQENYTGRWGQLTELANEVGCSVATASRWAKQARPQFKVVAPIATGGTYAVSTDRVRESWGGFHFYNLYHNCKRKFFIKYVLGIENRYTSQALIGGGAFHAGKAEWYRTADHGLSMEVCRAGIEAAKDEFETEEEYDRTIDRFPAMLDSWIMTHGVNDLERYTPLAIEKEIVLPVPNTEGFYVTMRADAVLQDNRYKQIYIMETKTTQFSKLIQEKGVYYGDQALMYIWGWLETAGKLVDGVIPDITYWNKKSHDVGKIEHWRGDIVTRNRSEIEDFLLGVAGTLNEISQKVRAYEEKGYPEEILFPRNTDRCMDFFRPCEFADICRNKLSKDSRLPPELRFTKQEIVSITDPIDR
jgi:hypothetical protein